MHVLLHVLLKLTTWHSPHVLETQAGHLKAPQCLVSLFLSQNGCPKLYWRFSKPLILIFVLRTESRFWNLDSCFWSLATVVEYNKNHHDGVSNTAVSIPCMNGTRLRPHNFAHFWNRILKLLDSSEAQKPGWKRSETFWKQSPQF